MRPTSVLATLSGRDRPGVTAAFLAALAAHDVDVRDVEQVVIRERLVLTVLVDLRGDTAALRNSATRTARALGMECEIAVADHGDSARPEPPGSHCHVLVLGHPLRAGALSHVAQRIADTGGNIDTVTQLSTEPVSALELVVRTEREAALRAELVQAARDTGVDIAVESARLRRRPKRLVVLDVDSTLLQDAEAVAAPAGAGDGSVHAQAAQLAGLTAARVAELQDRPGLVPGAGAFVHTLRRLGYRVGIVSSSLTTPTGRLVEEFGLDFAAGNELELVDGVATGRLRGPAVDRAGKAAALRRFAEDCDVPLAQTVAVGDGPDDTDLLVAAGLGIAFNAKAALRAAADAEVNLPYLDSVLFVLGISRQELAEAALERGPR